jgi:hypothetical protein
MEGNLGKEIDHTDFGKNSWSKGYSVIQPALATACSNKYRLFYGFVCSQFYSSCVVYSCCLLYSFLIVRKVCSSNLH